MMLPNSNDGTTLVQLQRRTRLTFQQMQCNYNIISATTSYFLPEKELQFGQVSTFIPRSVVSTPTYMHNYYCSIYLRDDFIATTVCGVAVKKCGVVFMNTAPHFLHLYVLEIYEQNCNLTSLVHTFAGMREPVVALQEFVWERTHGLSLNLLIFLLSSQVLQQYSSPLPPLPLVLQQISSRRITLTSSATNTPGGNNTCK
eukprot:gene3348-6021_t